MSALNLLPEPGFEPPLGEFWFRKNQLFMTLSATFLYIDDDDDDDIDDDLDESLDDIQEGRSFDDDPPLLLLLGRAAMFEK